MRSRGTVAAGTRSRAMVRHLLPMLQVIDARTVLDRAPRPNVRVQRVVECLVADQSGAIVFAARNEQGEGA